MPQVNYLSGKIVGLYCFVILFSVTFNYFSVLYLQLNGQLQIQHKGKRQKIKKHNNNNKEIIIKIASYSPGK
jgi:hypothetical protein